MDWKGNAGVEVKRWVIHNHLHYFILSAILFSTKVLKNGQFAC